MFEGDLRQVPRIRRGRKKTVRKADGFVL